MLLPNLIVNNVFQPASFKVIFWIFQHHGVIFFFFLPKWGSFKKNYKFRQVVSIRHDFIWTNRSNLTRLCHVILKLCQLSTTSALSYSSCVNLARLLPCHTEKLTNLKMWNNTWSIHDYPIFLFLKTNTLRKLCIKLIFNIT